MALLYKKRADFWRGMVDLTVYFKDEIRYTADHPTRILNRYLSIYQKEIKPKDATVHSFSKEFLYAINPTMEQLGLTKEECQLIQAFANGLGVSDIEGQMNHCEHYGHLFSERSQNSASEYVSKGKLYRSLGWLSAATVAVIVM